MIFHLRGLECAILRLEPGEDGLGRQDTDVFQGFLAALKRSAVDKRTRRDATRPALAQLRQSHLLISPADNPLSPNHVGRFARVRTNPESDFWWRWHVDPCSLASTLKSSRVRAPDAVCPTSTALYPLRAATALRAFILYSCNFRSPSPNWTG